LKVEILSLTEDTIRFVLEDVDVAFANAFRRTVIADVPTFTIDDLFIFDNSSVVADEIMAHRIGLIPLKTDLDSYVLPEDCECESELGCGLCRVVLTLDVEAEGEIRTVTSGDFVSEDPKIVPVSPGIPITKLAPGQAVRLEAYARLGTGKTHAKWQPVSEAVYQNIGDLEINEKTCTACAKCVEACPTNVLEIEGGKLRVADIYACILCGDCVNACPVEPAAITQGMKDKTFLFTVESTGSLPPERILTEAGRILIEKLNELIGKIERGETSDEIVEMELVAEKARGIYSVGSGDYDDEDEDEEGIEEE
jgi:DNA-directed RNA polymerase subunit D